MTEIKNGTDENKISYNGIFTVLCVLLATAFFLIYFITQSDNVMAVWLIVCSVLLAIKVSNNRCLLMLFTMLALLNISIAFNGYLIPERRITWTGVAYDANVMTTSISVVSLFITTLLFSVKRQREIKEFQFLDNSVIFYGLIFVELVICVLALILPMGNFNKILGYSDVIFLFICFFSGNKKDKVIKTVILLGIYLAVLIARVAIFNAGTGRSSFVMSFFVVFIFLFINKIKLRTLIITLLAFMGVMILLASYRNGVFESSGGILESFYSTVFLNDTAEFSYTTSTTIVGMKFYHSSLTDRMTSFLHFIISQIIGSGSSITSMSNLSILSRKFYIHYYGTIFPFYFWYWFGYIGVILSGLFLGFLINRTYKSKKVLPSLIFIMIVARCPLWYMYSPTSLFRSTIFLVVVGYIAFKLVIKLLNIKK